MSIRARYLVRLDDTAGETDIISFGGMNGAMHISSFVKYGASL